MRGAISSIVVAISLAFTALAQSPGQPNEGARLTRDPATNAVTLSWWGRSGYSYFVQHSDDLRLWTYVPQVVVGQDALATVLLSTNAPSHYMRLEYELTALNLDSDGDGIPDIWEVKYGLNPHNPADATATAAGGGMTNAQHFANGSDPNAAPPPATITAGTPTLDADASTLLYPADDSALPLKNGNFSSPALGTLNYKTYPGIEGWTAISGSLVELQKISTGSGGQYCELDSHWPGTDHSGASDHGIKQTVSLNRGHYILIFDYRGRAVPATTTRPAFTAGDFTASATPDGGTEMTLVTKNGAATAWKRAYASFDVTGGNPNNPQVPVTFKFDIADAPDSYGAFIDCVMLVPSWLQIYDGQEAPKPVPEKTKYSTGAFTVANLNDSDGNGAPDAGQSPVPAESDLMRLELTSPAGVKGSVKVTVVTGGAVVTDKVKLWADKDKTTAIAFETGTNYKIYAIPAGAPLAETIWVEAVAISTAVRDIEIQVSHKSAEAGSEWKDGIDKVRATAVWAQLAPTGMKTAGNGYPAGWPAATNNSEYTNFKNTFDNDLGGKFGIFDARPQNDWFAHSIGFQMQVLPPGIDDEQVVFDVSRQRESIAWQFGGGVWSEIQAAQTYPTAEIVNDDRNNSDEYDTPQKDTADTNTPKKAYIYSLDNPNVLLSVLKANTTRFIQRGNFREFVRVKFGILPFTNANDAAEGSRCSDWILWQIREDMTKDGSGNWEHTAGGDFWLKAGATALGTHP